MKNSSDLAAVNKDVATHKRLKKTVQTLCKKPEFSFRDIDVLKPNSFRQSDNVFILGSGASINHIKGGFISIKEKGDIIGLNFSLLLDIMPSVFFVHEPWLPQPHEMKKYFGLLQYRYESYRHIPLIYDYRQTVAAKVSLDLFPQSLRNRTYLNSPLQLPCNNVSLMKDILEDYSRKGWFKTGSFSHLIHHMSTMSLAVHFAICAGYKNIILLGVDLNNASYFFDEIKSNVPVDLLPNMQRDRKKMHSTADPKFILRDKSLPFDKYLILLRDKIMGPKGINLYIGSSTSLLYPRLPLWPDLE
jgi:hypothetical protein